MTDENKVFTNEVIKDAPFPTEGVAEGGSSQSTKDVYTPSEIKETPFPIKKTANELLSASLNTKSRKILGVFQFTKYGAIQVGTLEVGVSGEIKISPTGIVAKNKDGTITFVLDGDTGDASFLGNVAAGSLISGIITLGGLGNGNGILIVKDASGNIILQADKDGYHAYNTSAVEKVRLASQNGLDIYGDDGQTVTFSNVAGGTLYGYMGYVSSANELQLASGNGKSLTLFSSNNGWFMAEQKIIIGTLNNDVEIAVGTGHIIDMNAPLVGFGGNVSIVGDLIVGGFKSSVANTKTGKVLLYANESPDNWFMDFCETKDKIHSTFLEVTVPPYKFIKCDDGTYQVWGKRKGFSEKSRRFEKTDKRTPYISNHKKQNPKQLFKHQIDFANKMRKENNKKKLILKQSLP